MASLFASLTSASKDTLFPATCRRPHARSRRRASITSPSLCREMFAVVCILGERDRRSLRPPAEPRSAAALRAAPSATTSTSRSPARGRSGRRSSAPSSASRTRSASPTPTRTATSAAGPSPAGASPTSSTASSFLEQAYDATDPDYDGRVTVPVLWDKEDGQIVSNESADIVRIFDEWAGGDLYPRGQARRDRRAQRVDLQRVPERRLPRRLRPLTGGLRRGLPRRLRRARPARGAPAASAATSPATRSPRPTGACSPRCCASTPSTTRTSAATARA